MMSTRHTRCAALRGPRTRAARKNLVLGWGEGGHRAKPLPHPSRGALPAAQTPEYPGRLYFSPGRANIWILLLRLKLITTGWATPEQREALDGHGGWEDARQWDDALRTACTRFQLSQGRRGGRADGYPDAETWQALWAG